MAKILDLSIDFPDIDGISSRQIWYAEQLREKYVRWNEERFREIEEISMTERDKRSLDYNDNYLSTLDIDFTDEELCVLFNCHAGGVIGTLKEYFEEVESEVHEYIYGQ